MRKRVDLTLLIGIVALVVFGVVMVYSASSLVAYTQFKNTQFFFWRDLRYAILGLIGMAIAANIDHRLWERNARWMLGVTFILLLSVFVFSKGAINGAHRWVELGGFSFQPSEMAKFTFLVYVSAWLAQRKSAVASITETFIPFVGVVLGVAILLLMQPDFGTLTVILVAALSVFWVAGMTWQQVGIGAVILALGLSVILSAPYRRERLAAFFNPEQDTGGTAYHVKNISIAIGSGGWFGLGFGESKQKRLFLPEPHTDSIFAITVEELGFFVGAALVLILSMVVYRGLRIAKYAPDQFGRLLATGITAWFAYQTFLNLAAMLQLVPLKGVPLPFVSYGGTNLIISLVAVGVLLSISRHLNVTDEPDSSPRTQGRQTRTVRATAHTHRVRYPS